MKKRIAAASLFILILISVYYIFFINKTVSDSSAEKEKTINKIHKYKFGLATGLGKLGDKSYNDMLYNGMINAQKKFGIIFDYEEPENSKDTKRALLDLINKDCSVIFAGEGYIMPYHVDSLAQVHKDIRFIVIDSEALNYYPNVSSITFKQNEGSFLAGVLSAQMSETGNIAAVGGTDISVIQDFITGYKAGAEYINPNINVYTDFVSRLDKDNPWSNPQAGKEIADKLFEEKNTDIIFGIAAASNIGIFNSASEHNKYAVGVDSDQDFLKKGTVLTSMMKRLDKGIVFMVEKIINGNFVNKNYDLGIKEGGVSLSPMTYTKDKIPAKHLKKIDKIKQEIIKGEITVPKWKKSS